MRNFLRKLYKIWGNLMAYGLHIYYNRWCNKIIRLQNIPNKKVAGEDLYLSKWKQLSHNVNPKYYRIFSNYIEPSPNIVPEDICHNIIEHVLNPAKHRVFYSDKNMYDKLFKKGTLPQTILRCIQGTFYDSNYKIIDSTKIDNLINDIQFHSVILKPTIDSDSGHNVCLFKKADDNVFYNIQNDKKLNFNLLKSAGNNWILQECLEQHSCMSTFNSTSVNTLRVLVYRSPFDNTSRVLNTIMRIGKKGSHIDNAHAGGLYVGISQDGKVGNFLCDQYGNKYHNFNDLVFKDNNYIIPNFDKVIELAKYVGDSIIHLRLLALDIMIDKEGEPHLIEFNIYALSTWLFQFTTSSAFGEYTNEIIQYCKEKKSQIERVKVSVW